MATTLTTNKKDYLPGETVTFTLSQFDPGSSFVFAVRDSASDPGDDGVANVYSPFWVTDGGLGDRDGLVNGQIVAQWVVPADPDGAGPQVAPALNARLEATASTASTSGTGGVVVASTTFTDAGPNPPPVQLYYVPEPEDQLLQALQSIENGGPSTAPSSPVTNYISIAIAGSGTIIYYDQGENGYVNDIANPTAAEIYNAATNPGGVQIWGNGIASDGVAPGYASDLLSAGNVIVLQSTVPVPTPGANFYFDGGDKIGVTKSVAVTRTGWAEGPDTLLAGSVEVLDTSKWGTEYRVPVGVNVSSPDDAQKFEYTGLFIMAGEQGATISVDRNADGDFADAGDLLNVSLVEGQSQLVDGNVNVGAKVVSDKPVQVVMLTGDIASNYESRDSSLLPTSLWTNSYYAPVSTANGDATQVWLYNPGSSAITVNYEWRVGSGAKTTGLSVSVPGSATAGGYVSVELPDNAAAHFYTTGVNPSKFYAFSTTDADGDSGDNQAWDWGYTLIPETSLSSQVIVGLGLGQDPTLPLTENGNPLWLTTVGNGETAVTVYVDYNGDNVGALTDPNGNKYDLALSLKELQQGIVYDPDGNQTGMLAYVLAPNVKLAAAWGQDPATASASNPGLDVGTSVPPLPLFDAGKNGTLSIDNDGNEVISAGDEILYTITINNISRAPVSSILLKDVFPAHTTYVANSTYFTNELNVTTQITDAGTTAFPLDEGGVIINPLSPLPVGQTYKVTFKVVIDNLANLGGVTTIINKGDATAGGVTVPFQDTTPLSFVSIQKEVSADGNTWFDADDPTGPVIPIGQLVYYRVVVTNDGALPATVDLEDQIILPVVGPGLNFTFGGGNSQTATVNPGTQVTTNVITILAAAGQHEDRVSVIATVNDGGVNKPIKVQPDDANYFGSQYGLNITKDATVPGGSADVAGEVISYTIGVQNTGNQTLTGVTVSDPFISNLTRVADTTGDNDNLLEVGETWAYTASHTVTQAEIDAGVPIVNTATADSNETGPDTDDAAIPVAQNPSLNITKNATVPGGSADVAGEVISYTIGVQNTGNQTLTGVTVSDPFISNLTRVADTTGDNDNLLEVGETWAYTASHTVTQAEIDAGGNIVNTATADSNETGPDTDDASIPVAQNPSLNITKDATVPGGSADVAGEVISYTIGVQNTGNQTLTGVTVSDPFISNLTRIADTTGDNDNLLEVGETWAYTASHTVTQAEIDSGNNIVNTATADSNETGPDTDDASIPVTQSPSLNIVKNASVPGNTADVAGEVISYTIGVQNTGNQTLTGVTVSDPFISNLTRIADTTGDNDNDLEVGETWAYTASHTVTQAEIDAGGNIVNTATADSNETGPDTDDASVPVTQAPSLNIVKDATVPGGSADVAGEVISYTIGVQNTGNQTLTGVTVSDPFISNLTRIADTTGDNDNLLEVGETWAYTASHTVTQAEIDAGGNIVNTATADSNETGPDTDDASVPVTQAPSLNIVKDATVPGGSADVAGEVISYTIGVQNTGNQTLTGVTVSDPFISNLTRIADTTGDNDNLLEVGETWAYTASHTVTQAEIDSGNNIVNTATADSNETGPDTDDASIPVTQSPSLNIVKNASVPGNTADVAGEVISYTIGVQNTGNQTLTGVTVSDPFISNLTRIADTTGDNDNDLEVGETWAYTASHTVTQAEIDAGGNIVNTATADSNETGPDTDDASIPVTQSPSLNIVKNASVPGNTADVAGEVISYTIGVQNTGNQTLTGVTVSDPFISNLTRVADTTGDNDNLLEVGETWAYTASHTVTQAEIDAGGNIVNTATADSNETGPDTDDAAIPVAQNPSLNITKDATVPGGSADVAGEVISYTIGVQNTGNQTLTGVTVSDPFISNLTRIADTTGDNDNLLEVGETWAYTASHTVTQAEIDAGGNIVNTATADSNETGPDTDDASIPVTQSPSLNIVKNASVPGNTADVAGEVISYTIGVQNTGNQTLTGVTVSDPFISNLTRVADTTGDNDNLLEVGETWAYTASHTVTQAEIDAGGNIVNTATADSNETGPDTDDAAIPVAQNPSLNITKDATVPGGSADVAGEVISYTIGVQNTGNQTLTGVTVSDPFISNLTRIADTTGDNDNLLEVGETWAYTASHTVTQAEIDSGNNIVNTATADSNETGPDTDDASIPVVQSPSLNIVKNASVPGNTADVAGEVISYTIGVQNTGNQTLTGVTVSDPFISNLTRIADTTGDNDDDLEVGETWAYTASHTVTQAEIDAGVPIVNTATADSNETGPDTDDASVPVTQAPSLNIVKDATVPGGSADVAGEVISYTIGVQNTGNQTLTGVTVSDPFISNLTRIADTTGDNDDDLEVGEAWAYTASHTVTQAEIDAGVPIVNTATADSNETGPDTDDASIPVAQNPSLNIVKSASVHGNTADVAGEVISYTIGVQNTGNQTLTGVTVSDPFISNLTRIADTTGDNDDDLEVGETWAYTASHTVTQAEIDAGVPIVNTATADSNETGPDTDDASVPVTQAPSLNIVKDATVPGGSADVAGEVISYTIGVQNTGNQTLTGVTVNDPFISNLTRIADTTGDNDNLLEVGETWAYTASHTVTQAEIDSGNNIVNTATADSNETGPDTDDASVPVTQAPSLNIVKDATVPGGTADAAGEVINYTIAVENTGTQTLTGVTVSDPFISNLTRVADTTGDNDNLLEVGETWAYTASHTVTQAEIDAGGNIVNTATADSNETGPDTDDAAIPVAQNPSLNITKDATVPGGSADVAGEVISYTIGVQNTGNQTLTGVTVSDPFISNLTRIADTTGDNDNLLEVGETWAYTASHTVTQAEIDSGNNIVNTATADSNETGPDTDDASIPVTQSPSLNIVKNASVPGNTADVAGEVISYTIGVQNTGNQTLTGVTVSDPFISNLTRVADTTGDNDNLLEVGETWAYTASHTVTQAEIDAGGNIVNTATADSNETGPDTDDAAIPVAQNPSLNITKDATVPGGSADVAGEVISYTIGVQNTGNQTLTGVTVSDPFISNLTRIADTTGDNDNLLEVGETWAYTASHTVTQAEIDSGNNIVNTATADSNETGPDTDDASVPVTQAPSLNIVKDATVPGGTADAAGEVINYTIAVENTGTQTLTGVTVSDPFISNLTRVADTTGDNDNLLEVGETWAYTASHTVTQAEIDAGGNIVNTATADSNETGPDTDDASIPVTQSPSLNIVKNASVPGNTADVAGEVISYTIGVQNTGNQTLTGVTVSDPFISNLTRIADTTGDNDNLLEVGETWAYTASHTVTQAEIDAGAPIVNTATADSNETGPDTDDASIPVVQNPSLNITKDATVPGGSADVAGEVISYTIGVQNTGNQTLTGVTVSDPFISNLTRIADTTGDNDNLLEVGETWAYTASHTVTQAEIDSGNNIVNVATADSNETGPDTDDASIPVTQSPSLNIVKNASVPGNTADVAGEVISYTIGVQNTGNQTLTGVTVSDPFISNLTRIADTTGDNDNLLEVGETWAYTASHTVTQAEIDAGVPIVNTATADSNETGPDTDDASVPVTQAPSLNIVKDATVPGGTADAAGEVINYTIAVENTGTQTLTGVTVSDPFISNLTRVADTTGDNDNLLEVGETWAYTASHTVTQAEIDAGGNIVNTATADSNETGPDTDDAAIPVAQNPSLNITKDATVPGGSADVAGEVISYTIGVQNTGNQTLTGVTVSDPFISNLTRIADTTGDNDNLLEVGETWAYTASHTVTQAEIDAGVPIVNTATADSNETGPDTDDASIPVTQSPSLNIVKNASVPGNTADVAGEVISYTIGVQNTGNQTLTGVTVSDPFISNLTRVADTTGDNDNLLEVGETWAYTASHTVTQAEIDAGVPIVNTATADSNETGPDTDDAAIPVAQNPSLNITKNATVPGGSADVAGEVISYTIGVQNTGNQTLTGVTVSDPFISNLTRVADTTGDNDNLLEVGETWAYTASHTVTQAEIDSGNNIVNTATADSNETGPDTDDASIPVTQSPSLNIVKNASVPGNTADVAGEVISYTIGVQNTGNQTLTGVTVSDPFISNLTRIADTTGDNDNLLEVGETWAYTASHTVTQAEIDAGVPIVNTATADSNETGPDTDDASVPVTQAPSLNIVKDATVPGGTADAAGEVINYTIAVENTGTQTLTGVTVSDPFISNLTRVADTTGDNDNLLEVGETWAYTASHTVTQAEIDAGGNIVNTATADSNETGPDTDDASIPVTQSPSLNIVKNASVPGNTADVAGEVISYTIGVQNTGNQTLTGVTVSDPFISNLTRIADTTGDNDNLLEVGETWAYTASHTVTQAEIDAGVPIVNTATADSNETGPDTDDASVPVTQAPSLNIVKDATVPGGTADAAGEVINYTIAVENTGTQTLTGVTVSDPFISNLTRVADTTGDNDNLLEVGETWAYTASHTVTQAEIDAGGNIVNTATADSNETGPDTDDASIPVTQSPSLNIVKNASVPGNTADVAGEVISYTIGVQNTGNQTLTGVTVSDPFISNLTRVADTTGDNDNLLEVGETWAYTASHTVTQAEIDSGNNIVNVATADSNETGPDTDDASIPVAQKPSLNIIKNATVPGGSANVAGEVISYTIAVQNTGTQTLTGVTVSDPFISNLTRVADTTGDNDNLLEVGETWAYTASHTVTQAEIDAGGNIVNTATADSNETGPDTDDASIPVTQSPSLNIVKNASVPGNTADVAGEVISYTIGVQNTGNQTLTGVTVSDPFISNLTRIADTTGDNDNLLEVGETWAYTASHTVTQAEIDSGNNIVNTATADSNETGPDTDDASIPVAQKPSLNIIKNATVPGGSANVAGEVISYTIGVQNTGNQTLTGVTVSDPFISNLTRIADTTGDNDNLLEVGETWAYTASHTVTQAEIDAGVPIVNTATADSNETGPDTDDASIPVVQNPSLNITKDATVPGGSADVAGEVISYTIGVQNTGNQTLTGVTVSDPFISNLTRIADTTGDNDNLLEVGETWAYTASHTVTQAEIDAGGNIVNVATADSNETGPDTDDASIPVVQKGSIGDFVWEDLNYNGKQDANEPGIAGVTVNLLDTNGNVVKTTQTGSGNDLGKYLFGNVAPGDYSIQVVKPSNGYFFTKPNVPGDDAVDSDVGNTGLTAIFNLSAGENDLTVDAGLYRKANLGDLVWLDRDNDGIQDGNEKGVDKVIVKLLDASGAQVAMTTTDASGKYLFSNLDPGSYTIEFDKSLAQTGAISVAKYPWSSKQNQGGDDGLDSDVSGSGFKATVSVTLESNENDLTQDAAITPIVIDLNGDGIKTIARADSQGTFDLLGTGSGINSGWLSGDDGFLVIDRNGNGSIDDISEMFGGSSKGDGFAKLASFDSNGDGVVDANDADFAGLKIWRDVNGNHQTDDGELMSLGDAGLVGLSISYSELPFLDAKGNLHLERGSATRADGSVVDMTDVYFNISTSDAAAAGVQAPTLAELMGSDNSFDSLMTDVAAVAGQEPFDTAMGEAADFTNGGYAADWSGMNSMEVQLVGQAEASFSGVF